MQHRGIIRLFVYLGGVLSFSVPVRQSKLLGCGLLGGISTQTNTKYFVGKTHLCLIATVLQTEPPTFAVETMDFQNNASVNMQRLYYLHVFILIKFVLSLKHSVFPIYLGLC